MMKKLVLLVLMLSGCGKHHLVWTTDEDPKPQVSKAPDLKESLGGVEVSFDDGVSLAYTPKVLSILAQYHLQAHFFIEGLTLMGDSEQTKERRELLKKQYAAGHIICGHSIDHKIMTNMSATKAAWEIDETNKLIKDAIGITPACFRMPYGRHNKITDKLLKDRKMERWDWSIDLQEWQRDPKTHQPKTADQVFEEFKRQYETLKERGQTKMILLIHDTKKITPEVLPRILAYLAATEKQ